MDSNTITLNGTPVHFVHAAIAWWQSRPPTDDHVMLEVYQRIHDANERPPRHVQEGDSGKPRVFYIRDRDPAHTQLIVEKHSPEVGQAATESLKIDALAINFTQTTVTAQTDHWNTFSGIWEELRAALDDAGLTDRNPAEMATTQVNPLGLSGTYLDIANLRASGMKVSEVAERLMSTEHTVSSYSKTISDAIKQFTGITGRIRIPEELRSLGYGKNYP